MAPTSISIHTNANGVDPISPLPVRVNDFAKNKIPSPTTEGRNPSSRLANRQQGKELDDLKNKYEETKVQMEKMKLQKNQNNKRLIEMSGLVKSLQGIPVSYNKTAEGNNLVNVQRKIEAIVYEMDEAKKRYDELRDEKYFQNDTIKSQEQQIKQMKEQVTVLNERLQEEELEQKEQAVEKQMANTEELEQQVMLQEMEIMNLTAEIDQLKVTKVSGTDIGTEIQQQKASNDAKYAEIQKMEEKLASMQEEQNAQKMNQASIVKKHTEEQSDFVMKPSSFTFREINKLEDDLATLKMEQEKAGAMEHPDKLQILPPPQKPIAARSGSKSQPWKQDLEWKENSCVKKTELEVVANNDVIFDEPVVSKSDHEEQDLLTLPSLTNEKKDVELARKNTGNKSVSSDNTLSLGLSIGFVAEELLEEQPEEIKQSKTLDSDSNNSGTSATGVSSASSFSASEIGAKMTLSDDEAASKMSLDDDNSASNLPQDNENNVVEVKHSDDGSIEVELKHSDDGSIEAISYSKPALKSAPSHSSDDGTALSETESSHGSHSGSSSSAGSTHGESSGGSSSGIYSSDGSTQSSSRSILEQIPEGVEAEMEASGSEWGSQSMLDVETKDLQTGSLILRKQLKESESKYGKLIGDYKQLVSKSQVSMEKLQEDNQKLREGQGVTLKSMTNDSEEESKTLYVKQENKMLIKSMEKQNEVMEKVVRNYEKLQTEHSRTLAELEEKKKRYDKLILDFSKLAKGGRTTDDYHRLKALHEAVVLKLADMGEENDKLENELDDAIDQSERKDIQIRAYDEAIAALNKTELDLKNLQDVHGDTIVELQKLSDKTKELQDLYDKEVAKTGNADKKLQQDYVDAKTELEMLITSNKEFKGIEEKLNTSEVKVTMLEDEAKKMKARLHKSKKKSTTRADQLKDVISQYKTMKEEHSKKCEELARLELATNDLGCKKGIQEMRTMEAALQKAKKEVVEAITGKEARENDLKIVLQHYEKLQAKYEKLKLESDSKTSDEFSAGSNSLPFDEAPTTSRISPAVEEKKKDPVLTEEDNKHQEEVLKLEKLLRESKVSINWKDDKIDKTLMELKSAKEEIAILETEKKELEVELSEVKSKLLLAKKEAENAGEKEGSGQERLRTAIAKHNQLQRVYDSLLKKFDNSRDELQKAKKDIKVKEEQEKHARKRAATVQLKKLPEDHDVVVQRLENFKEEMTTSKQNNEAVQQSESEKLEEEMENNKRLAEC